MYHIILCDDDEKYLNDLGNEVQSFFQSLGIKTKIYAFTGMEQISDHILKSCDIAIQTVNHFAIMGGFLAKHWFYSVLYTHTIFISVIGPFFGRSGDDVLPEPLELRIRQRFSVPVDNHKFRSGSGFCFTQAIHQTYRQGDVPLCGIGFLAP